MQPVRRQTSLHNDVGTIPYLLQGACNGVSIILGSYLLQSLHQPNGCLVVFQTRRVEVLEGVGKASQGEGKLWREAGEIPQGFELTPHSE